MIKIRKLVAKNFIILFVAVGLNNSGTCFFAQTQRRPPLTPQQINTLFGPPIGEVGAIPRLLSHGSGPVDVPCNLRNMVEDFIAMAPEDALMQLSSDSNLIVVGKAGKSVSHMLPNKAFLYSETPFVVEDVLKNNSEAPVQPFSTITVGQPGGRAPDRRA